MASISLEVFPPLSDRIAGQKVGRSITRVEIQERESLRELLQHLIRGEHRALAEAIYDAEADRLKRGFLVLLNGQTLASRQGLNTRLIDGDKVGILPAYAGGCLTKEG